MNHLLHLARAPRGRATPWSNLASGDCHSTLTAGQGEEPSSDIASPEVALNSVLDALELSGLTPIESRLLLWLSERDATAGELSAALEREASAIGPALRRLDMRGFVRRRSQSGREPGLSYSISVLGLSTLRPLVQRVADTGPAGTARLWDP